jgi:hypothetical protein
LASRWWGRGRPGYNLLEGWLGRAVNRSLAPALLGRLRLQRIGNLEFRLPRRGARRILSGRGTPPVYGCKTLGVLESCNLLWDRRCYGRDGRWFLALHRGGSRARSCAESSWLRRLPLWRRACRPWWPWWRHGPRESGRPAGWAIRCNRLAGWRPEAIGVRECSGLPPGVRGAIRAFARGRVPGRVILRRSIAGPSVLWSIGRCVIRVSDLGRIQAIGERQVVHSGSSRARFSANHHDGLANRRHAMPGPRRG